MRQKSTVIYAVPSGSDRSTLAASLISWLKANSFEWNEGSHLNNGVPFWHWRDPLYGGGMVEIDFDREGNLVVSGFETTIFGGESKQIGQVSDLGPLETAWPHNRWHIADDMRHAASLMPFQKVTLYIQDTLGLEGRVVGPEDADRARAAGYLSPLCDLSVEGREARAKRLKSNGAKARVGSAIAIISFTLSVFCFLSQLVLPTDSGAIILGISFFVSIVGLCSTYATNHGVDSDASGLSKVCMILGILGFFITMAALVPLFMRAEHF